MTFQLLSPFRSKATQFISHFAFEHGLERTHFRGTMRSCSVVIHRLLACLYDVPFGLYGFGVFFFEDSVKTLTRPFCLGAYSAIASWFILSSSKNFLISFETNCVLLSDTMALEIPNRENSVFSAFIIFLDVIEDNSITSGHFE